MSIVVNFGSEVSYVVFEKNKVKNYVRVCSCSASDLTGDSLYDIINGLVESNSRFLNEPVYITLSAGSGVVYKTFNIAQESIMINGSRTTVAERQNEIMEIMKGYLPFGLKGDYVSTIVSEYKTDSDYIVSCAYFPLEILNNIRNVFMKLDVSLLNVHPLVYGVYKALDSQRFKQLIIDCGDELMLVNGLGTIIWAKPSAYDDDFAKQYLISQSQVFYAINPDVAETLFIDYDRLPEYVMSGFSECTGNNMLGVATVGLLGNINSKKNTKSSGAVGEEDVMSANQKGGDKGVVAKLRLLFNGRGKK